MSLNIFMNGITGQVGAFLAKELLVQGHNIYTLVRGQNPQERVYQTLSKIGVSDKFFSQIHIVRGSVIEKIIFKSGTQISESGTEQSESGTEQSESGIQIDHVIHIAASLSFSSKDSADVFDTNILGTKNMLDLCKKLQCRFFHYVSTAYVAGKYSGRFSEKDLDVGQEFKNSYEKSKCDAEKLCWDWVKYNESVTLKVYRPGIVMGDQLGKTVNYSGFYVFLKILDEITKNKVRYKCSSLRIQAANAITKNIVAVDYVAKCMAAVVIEASKYSETLYLLPANAPQNIHIKGWLQELSGMDLALVDSAIERMNISERMIDKGLKLYADYMNHEPDFDTEYSQQRFNSLGVKPNIVCKDYFSRLLCYGQKDQWGRKKIVREVENNHPYFFNFLPLFIGRQILPGLEKINSVFVVKIKGERQENWKIQIQKGRITSINSFCEGEAVDFSYELPLEIFNDMISARIDPRSAFFSGKTDIQGNIEKGLKIANILRLFFKENSLWDQEANLSTAQRI